MWETGNFDELMKECRAIQGRLKDTKPKNKTPEQISREFANFMLQGKVNAALKLLDNNPALGIADLSENTLDKLNDLHPQASEADESILMTGDAPYFDPIIFNSIDES